MSICNLSINNFRVEVLCDHPVEEEEENKEECHDLDPHPFVKSLPPGLGIFVLEGEKSCGKGFTGDINS